MLDFGLEAVDFFEAVGGAVGGTIADDNVDEATFEREDLVVTIEVAEGGDVFVKGVFVGFDVVLKKGVGGAVAGDHFAFAVGEGVGEADAGVFVGVAAGFEVVVAGERVVEKGAETFADVVKIAERAGVVGVEMVGGLGYGLVLTDGGLVVLEGGGAWILAFGAMGFAAGELVFSDGGGDFAGTVADEDGMVDPVVAVAVFGGFAPKRIDEREGFGGGEGLFSGGSACVRRGGFLDALGVLGILGGFHGYIVAKMLDFGKFVV